MGPTACGAWRRASIASSTTPSTFRPRGDGAFRSRAALPALQRGHALPKRSYLGYLAAATSRMTLGTEVLVLPQRDPTLVAKQVSTPTRFGGRIRLGAGVGWQESEYESSARTSNTAARGWTSDRAVADVLDGAAGDVRVAALSRGPNGHGAEAPQGAASDLDRRQLRGRAAASGALGDGWLASRGATPRTAPVHRRHSTSRGTGARDPASIGLPGMVARRPATRKASGSTRSTRAWSPAWPS